MPMYNLIKHSSNYSETTWSLWFYSKDKTTNFNDNITNTDDFKLFTYKAKLLENTEAHPATNNANGILKNAAIDVSLKCLSNFWRSLAMPLINCIEELKLKWTKYCILSAASADNINANPNNIFIIKDTKLCVPVVTLLSRNNQNLSRLLSKRFERSVYWNEYQTKNENKDTTNEFRYFFQSNFIGVSRLFVLNSTNGDGNAKRSNARRYYLPKGITDNYNAIIDGKIFYNQLIDSDVKR